MPTDETQVNRQRIAAALEKRDILAPALEAFAAELPPGDSRGRLRELVTRLEAGATADEFCQAPDRSTVWLLLLGRDGDTPRLLGNLFDEATSEHHSRQRQKRIFCYPLFVFLASLAVLVFSCLIVIPTIKSIYDDFALTLPGITLWLLGLSHTIIDNPGDWIWGALLSVAGAWTCLRLVQIHGLPGRLGSMLTAGNARQLMAMARFTRQLAEALEAGLKLPAALRIAGHATDQRTTRRVVLRLADDVEQNQVNWTGAAVARYLPTTVIHALQANPGHAPNTPLLRQLADLYTARVHDRYSWSNGYLAHFSIAGVGLLVGFVFLALFIPLANLIRLLTY